MKKINIELDVNDDFVLPKNFEEHGEKIIKLGYEVYNNIEKLSLLEHQTMKIVELEKEYEKKMLNYEQKIKYYEIQVKEQKALETQQVSEYIEKGRAQRESELNYLRNQIKEKDEKMVQMIEYQKNSMVEGLNKQMMNVLDELQIFNNYVGASTAQKGSVGESIVYQYICQHFPNYNVQDTSKNNSSMSDLYMVSSDSKYQILVEVKNVNILSPNDKSKFEYDIQMSSKNNKINGAIMYSLNNANINSRSLNIVYHYGVPTLYVSNVKQNMDVIRYGIFIMEELIKKNKYYQEKSEENEIHNDFVKIIDIMNKSLENEYEMMEKDRKQILVMENQYKERYKNVTEQMVQIKNMMDKYNIDLRVKSKENVVEKSMEDFRDEILERIVNHNEYMKEQINQNSLIKMGGIKEIRSLLKTYTKKENVIIVEEE